jgi:predicted kinase
VRRGSAGRRPGEGLVPRPGPGADHGQRDRFPSAVLVSGPPAAGKTTLATALATALHYAIVDLDTVTGPLTRAALRLSGEDGAAIDSSAGQRLRASRYETLFDVASANLAAGIGVVIAAPFSAERSSPARFEDLVRRLCPGDRADSVALLYIDTSDDVVRRRLKSRNADRDRAKLLRAPAAARPAPLVPQAIALDGTHGIVQQLAHALDALAQPPRSRPTQAASC